MQTIQPDWPAPPNVRAAVTTRNGGVSLSPWNSLNLGVHVEDDPKHVAENRQRIITALELGSEPQWLTQVHGIAVANLDQPNPLIEADAAMTTQVGPVCVAQTADCLPVLFAARDGAAVAAAHAGWRGLADGVLEATINAMSTRPDHLMAWLGPAIGPRAFEVGQDVIDAFTAHDPGAVACFVSANQPGKWWGDLYSLAKRRLQLAGVTAIYGGGECTYTDTERFFSFRRDGQRTGRMASLIWKTG